MFTTCIFGTIWNLLMLAIEILVDMDFSKILIFSKFYSTCPNFILTHYSEFLIFFHDFLCKMKLKTQDSYFVNQNFFTPLTSSCPNFYDNEHKLALGLSYDQAETFFRSQGFLGTLTTERTVTPLYASDGNPIELVAEQEHAGNGNDPGTKKRGDVGPAEVTGKLNIYGLYASDNFNYSEKLTFNNAIRDEFSEPHLH